MDHKDFEVTSGEQPPEYQPNPYNHNASQYPGNIGYPQPEQPGNIGYPQSQQPGNIGYPQSQQPGNIGYPQSQQPQPYSNTTDVVRTFSEQPVTFHDIGPAPDAMVVSIISLFFCLPFGIVAVVKAAEARSRNEAGDFIGAHYASKLARQFALGAIGVAICLFTLYLFIILIG